ncbi:TetR/AcrR family transcriptional regulator [Nocardia sp. CDC159]|uniref:TetR/AcrR family transcriptional regulator n=1 Tax=Nocardia pulmonis TaxID=2951408 RepID=A0A9X2IY14_9NOCA|nr:MULTISPECIES: TetR/AcrR family transcriptional regulator [Nocardia]MCM6775209.1 TetR/AcrR family transcriptional regulator [Nocardia pulmonis]MCM6789679.1 TetR/AcrR family transcriptional regulator [Nocardia sp. CDC159]
MSEKPSPSRRSERARAAILTAAAELIREVPYPKLGIEAIAARAGVGKQTIYRWWPSKGAVLLDAMLESYSSPSGVVFPDSGDIRADLRLLLHGTVAELSDPARDGFLRAMYIEIQHDPDIGRYYRERLLLPQRAALIARLDAAVAAGQLRADFDPDIAVDLLLGPLQYRWSLGLDGLTPGYADAILDAALDYLRPA